MVHLYRPQTGPELIGLIGALVPHGDAHVARDPTEDLCVAPVTTGISWTRPCRHPAPVESSCHRERRGQILENGRAYHFASRGPRVRIPPSHQALKIKRLRKVLGSGTGRNSAAHSADSGLRIATPSALCAGRPERSRRGGQPRRGGSSRRAPGRRLEDQTLPAR